MPPAAVETLQMMLCHPDLPCAPGPRLRPGTPPQITSDQNTILSLRACRDPWQCRRRGNIPKKFDRTADEWRKGHCDDCI